MAMKATSYKNITVDAQQNLAMFHRHVGDKLYIKVDKGHDPQFPDYEYYRVCKTHPSIMKIKPRTLRISVITKSSTMWLFNDTWARRIKFVTPREFNGVGNSVINLIKGYLMDPE